MAGCRTTNFNCMSRSDASSPELRTASSAALAVAAAGKATAGCTGSCGQRSRMGQTPCKTRPRDWPPYLHYVSLPSLSSSIVDRAASESILRSTTGVLARLLARFPPPLIDTAPPPPPPPPHRYNHRHPSTIGISLSATASSTCARLAALSGQRPVEQSVHGVSGTVLLKLRQVHVHAPAESRNGRPQL